jgi:hypothetical protein
MPLQVAYRMAAHRSSSSSLARETHTLASAGRRRRRWKNLTQSTTEEYSEFSSHVHVVPIYQGLYPREAEWSKGCDPSLVRSSTLLSTWTVCLPIRTSDTTTRAASTYIRGGGGELGVDALASTPGGASLRSNSLAMREIQSGSSRSCASSSCSRAQRTVARMSLNIGCDRYGIWRWVLPDCRCLALRLRSIHLASCSQDTQHETRV